MRGIVRGIAAFFILAIFPCAAGAYSYAEAEDPMAVVFKDGVVAAREGRWGDARKKFEEGVALQKGHHFRADGLRPGFEAAVTEKNVSRTAEIFANLVYLSIREKLHANIRAGLGDFNKGKSRLALARKSYLDVLDGNVRSRDPGASGEILKSFDKALEALGNPGLFGIGEKKPDPAKYGNAVKKIENLIEKAFPSFAGSQAG